MQRSAKELRELVCVVSKHFAPEHAEKVRRVLTLLVARSPEYDRIQEKWCSEDMGDEKRALLEKKEASIENWARELVATLPESLTGRVTVKFGGDPRGYCVKLVVPNCPHDGNTWGQGGEYGV